MPDNEQHPPSMNSQRVAWNTRYHLKGRQWGNAPSEVSFTPDSGTILELGIGDGKNLRVRSDAGAHYIGLDFSREALHLCQKEPALISIPLLLADACFLPIKDGMVHVVYAHHIMGHLSAGLTEIFIDEVWRVLCPGGRLILTVFAKGDMRDTTGTEIEPSAYLRGDGIITRYYSLDMIHSICRMFITREIKRVEWPMKIRGKNYRRAEIVAYYKK